MSTDLVTCLSLCKPNIEGQSTPCFLQVFFLFPFPFCSAQKPEKAKRVVHSQATIDHDSSVPPIHIMPPTTTIRLKSPTHGTPNNCSNVCTEVRINFDSGVFILLDYRVAHVPPPYVKKGRHNLPDFCGSRTCDKHDIAKLHLVKLSPAFVQVYGVL